MQIFDISLEFYMFLNSFSLKIWKCKSTNFSDTLGTKSEKYFIYNATI